MGKRAARPMQNVALKLDVAGVALRRGVVARSGPRPGRPSVSALRKGAGMGYSTAFDLLRRPWRITRLDLGTLERVAKFYQCHPAELLVYNPDAPPRARQVQHQNPLEKGTTAAFAARLRRVRTVEVQRDGGGGYLGLDDED